MRVNFTIIYFDSNCPIGFFPVLVTNYASRRNIRSLKRNLHRLWFWGGKWTFGDVPESWKRVRSISRLPSKFSEHIVIFVTIDLLLPFQVRSPAIRKHFFGPAIGPEPFIAMRRIWQRPWLRLVVDEV